MHLFAILMALWVLVVLIPTDHDPDDGRDWWE
jgi:hypothetical protein